ncbi:MAG: MarP family serine protease [Acidimicrobiales bacterium]
MDVVDIVIVLVLVAAALHGLRLGALVQVLSFGGFLLGLTIGALVAGAVASSLHSTNVRAAVALVLVIGLGLVFGVVGRLLGSMGGMAVRRVHLGGIDSVAGVGVAVVAALLSTWLVANELAQTRFTSVSSAVQRSSIVRAVDAVMPPLPDFFSRIQSLLGGSGFPPVFSQLEPPPSKAPLPTTAFAASVAGPAEPSTVKILGQACGYLQEGSGFVAAPGLVVTNAHVVAGEPATQVYVGGVPYDATVVLFTPTFDLAVLRTAAPAGAPLTLDPSTVGHGAAGAIVGYPENGSLTVGPAAVDGVITAQGRNIYNQGTVSRQVYQVDAKVQPGNSGGPLLGGHGQVIGVVFSRSTVYTDVGYALTSPGVLSRVAQARSRTSPASTGSCAGG